MTIQIRTYIFRTKNVSFYCFKQNKRLFSYNPTHYSGNKKNHEDPIHLQDIQTQQLRSIFVKQRNFWNQWNTQKSEKTMSSTLENIVIYLFIVWYRAYWVRLLNNSWIASNSNDLNLLNIARAIYIIHRVRWEFFIWMFFYFFLIQY